MGTYGCVDKKKRTKTNGAIRHRKRNRFPQRILDGLFKMLKMKPTPIWVSMAFKRTIGKSKMMYIATPFHFCPSNIGNTNPAAEAIKIVGKIVN